MGALTDRTIMKVLEGIIKNTRAALHVPEGVGLKEYAEQVHAKLEALEAERDVAGAGHENFLDDLAEAMWGTDGPEDPTEEELVEQARQARKQSKLSALRASSIEAACKSRTDALEKIRRTLKLPAWTEANDIAMEVIEVADKSFEYSKIVDSIRRGMWVPEEDPGYVCEVRGPRCSGKATWRLISNLRDKADEIGVDSYWICEDCYQAALKRLRSRG